MEGSRIRFRVGDAILNRYFKVVYVIPHLPQDFADASLFQGFTPSLLSAAPVFSQILSLPADIRELYSSRRDIVISRLVGNLPYYTFPLDITYLREFTDNPNTRFACVISDHTTVSEVQRLVGDAEQTFLHVTTANVDGIEQLRNLNPERIREWVERVIKSDNLNQQEVEALESITKSKDRLKRKQLKLNSRNHLLTYPNEAVLSALCCSLSEPVDLKPRREEDYLIALLRSFDAVSQARSDLYEQLARNGVNHPLDVVLTTPSFYAHRHDGQDFDVIPRNAEGRQFVYVMKALLRQEGYFMKGVGDEFLETMKGSVAQGLVGIRRAEMEAHTIAVALRAASFGAPVFRLPFLFRKLRPLLISFLDCIEGANPHKQFKLNKLMRRIKAQLSESIDERIVGRLQNLKTVKIVSDLPLEWIDLDGLPLSLAMDASRIAGTPGNLMFAECISNSPTVIPLRAFKEVLVISSFTEGDPIKDVLKHSLSLVLDNEDERVSVRHVYVRNRKEFVEALNDYQGAVLVFDGHGHSEGPRGIGSLMVGGEPMDIWSLKGEVRVPPIVIFSACSTHDVMGSHASPSNGFLMLGARTVLASLLPLNAVTAAAFVARLLFRISMFLPLSIDLDLGVSRWNSFIAGMLRMAFVTECLLVLVKEYRGLLNEQAFEYVHLRANHEINSGSETWFKEFIKLVAAELGVSNREIRRVLTEKAAFTESSAYVQMGSPENILVVSDEILEELARTDSSLVEKGVF